MKKTLAVTFIISVLVTFSIGIIAFMLMLPQRSHVASGSVSEYETIKKSEYTYESTKDITADALTHEYIITSEDIANFKKNNQYKAGNSDPFSVTSSGNTDSGNKGQSGNTSNNSGNQNNSSTSTTDKITNSNGGVANPPATNK